MSKNPIVNAFGALAYILAVVGVITLVSETQGSKPDTFFAPVAFLSLFTLSAAVMTTVFFYQPLQLFLGGKKKEAVNLLIQTIGAFAAITVVIWMLVVAGVV